MISFLEGDVAERSGTRVVISVGGVGYDVQVPASTLAKLPPVGRPARVYTRLVVRDDAMTLFGFANADERELFDLLVTVSGIGPKVALSFLSVLSPDAFRRAVSSGDIGALTVVPGVGKKVAQRVVLDLKDKLGAEDVVIVDGPLADVREALAGARAVAAGGERRDDRARAQRRRARRGPPPRGVAARGSGVG